MSIGFGCFPGDGQDCNALLAADTLMYHNKTERKLGSLVTREAPPETGPALRTDDPGDGEAFPLQRAA